MATYKKKWDTVVGGQSSKAQTRAVAKLLIAELDATTTRMNSIPGQIDIDNAALTSPSNGYSNAGYTAHEIFTGLYLLVEYFYGQYNADVQTHMFYNMTVCTSLTHNGSNVVVGGTILQENRTTPTASPSGITQKTVENRIFKSDTCFWVIVGGGLIYNIQYPILSGSAFAVKSNNLDGTPNNDFFSAFSMNDVWRVGNNSNDPSAVSGWRLAGYQKTENNLQNENLFSPRFASATMNSDLNAILIRVNHLPQYGVCSPCHDIVLAPTSILTSGTIIDVDLGAGVRQYIPPPGFPTPRIFPRSYLSDYTYLLPWYD